MKGDWNRWLFLFIAALFLAGCESSKQTPEYGNYPTAVGKIITTKCAVSGCHDAQSSGACNGLDLSSWQTMFAGGANGSVTIPYFDGYSTMFIYTNTYNDLGLSTPPSMPLYRTPLSHDEEVTIKNWIDNGAPNENGFVMWSDNPMRKKVYVCNQGCDNVTVFDEQSQLIMRYVNVGSGSLPGQAPHQVAVSPDGQYWYVIFYQNCQYLQKYSTATDKLVGEVSLGGGSWNTMTISSDGTKAFCVSWSGSYPLGSPPITYVELDSMKALQYNGLPLTWAHGSALTNHDSILYVTCNSGNFLYKIDVSDPYSPNILKSVVLDGSGTPNVSTTTCQPHVCEVSPDGNSLYCTLQASNQVAVVDIASGKVTSTINTGIYPQEVSFSTNPATPYAFVTCQDDTVTYPGEYGTVSVINYTTNNLITSIFAGWQPHGLAVDDNAGIVYVACRNVASGGPPPHHTTACAGNDGYMSFIKISTLQVNLQKRIELSVDPYFVAIRH